MRLAAITINKTVLEESILSKTAAAVAVMLAMGVGGKVMHKMLRAHGMHVEPAEVARLIKAPEVQQEAERLKPKVSAKSTAPATSASVAPAQNNAEQYLTRVLFAEAANQSRAAKEAVAQVIMNRVARRGYPNSIIGVITAKNAFTSYPDSPLWISSASPDQLPKLDKAAYDECASVANAAINNRLPNRIGDAVLYHDTSIAKPWGEAAQEIGRVGNFVFYREVVIR